MGLRRQLTLFFTTKKNIAVNINTSIKCLILDVAGPIRHQDVQTNCQNAYARFSIYLQRLDVYIEPKTSKNEHSVLNFNIISKTKDRLQ